MKRTLLFVGLLSLAVAVGHFAPEMIGTAEASVPSVSSEVAHVVTTARPKGVEGLVLYLNGSPSQTAVNVTTATGAAAASATFTAGSCITIQCSTDSCVLPGTAVSCATNSSSRGIYLRANDPPYPLCLKNNETQFAAIAASSAGSCGAWVLQ